VLIYLTLAATILATSALSGVLGMGGGMILMGVMAALLPIGTAMVLHGLTGVSANGYRAWLLRRHIAWKILGLYAVSAVATTALLWQWRFVPSPMTVYLILGGLPLVVMALPRRLAFDATRPWHAVLSGILVTVVQCTAGVAGPLLDVFFVHAPLDRRAIVATKAMTQTLSHALKTVYFGGMVAVADDTAWVYAVAVGLSLVGTAIGRRYLESMDDAKFRLWSRRLILTICAVYIGKAAYAFAAI
jgi:uncharacterized membrane protein YfcA